MGSEMCIRDSIECLVLLPQLVSKWDALLFSVQAHNITSSREDFIHQAMEDQFPELNKTFVEGIVQKYLENILNCVNLA